MTTLPIIRRPFLLDSFFNEVFTDDFWTPFDKQFNDLARQLNSPKFLPADKGYPKVNVIEFDDKVKWEVTVTGLSKDDLEVGVKTDPEGNRALILKHEKTDGTEEDGKYRLREIRMSSFRKSFLLPETLDTDEVKTTCKDGLLTIEINKLVADKKEEDYKLIEIA